MKAFDAYTDDDGVRWEMLYDERAEYEKDEETGKIREKNRVIVDFRYRRDGEEEWLALPSWATVRDEAKITLCFFDEDDETEELTFLDVVAG